MKNRLGSLLEKFAYLSISAALSSAIVLHQLDQTQEVTTPKVLRAERLEIVDKHGKPCVVLAAGDYGGSLKVFSPAKGEGHEGIIAYLGSVFGNDLQFLLKQPKVDGESTVGIFIGGEPSCPTISGQSGGLPNFRIGGLANGKPQLELWHLNEPEPYFSK